MNKQDLEKKYQEAKNIVNELSKAGMVVSLIRFETEYDMVATSTLQMYINQMFLRCVNINGFNRTLAGMAVTEDNCRPTWQQLTDCIAERLKIVRWQDPWDERSAEIWNEVKIHKDKWFRFYTDEEGVQRVDTTYETT